MTRWSDRKTGQASRGRRSGVVFPIRFRTEELDAIRAQLPPGLGVSEWLRTCARDALHIDEVIPVQDARAGNTPPAEPLGAGVGNTRAPRSATPPIVLDLCAGTGAWSKPYAAAGYDVRRVTLPELDVLTYEPPEGVHGVLAAPPCTAFSLARNGRPATTIELHAGLDVVCACLRIIATCRPRWWALENPVGLLGHFMGSPTFTFQPWWFGDAWTKRTSLWGVFRPPLQREFVEPTHSAARRTSKVERARTPSGFARAFFEVNP